MMLVHQRVLAVLIGSSLLAIFIHPALAAMYPALIFLKFLKNWRVGYFETLITTFLRDISGLAGFLFFFPAHVFPDATKCKRL